MVFEVFAPPHRRPPSFSGLPAQAGYGPASTDRSPCTLAFPPKFVKTRWAPLNADGLNNRQPRMSAKTPEAPMEKHGLWFLPSGVFFFLLPDLPSKPFGLNCLTGENNIFTDRSLIRRGRASLLPLLRTAFFSK